MSKANPIRQVEGLRAELALSSGAIEVVCRVSFNTCRMISVDPEAWLRWVLARVSDHEMRHIDEMKHWN